MSTKQPGTEMGNWGKILTAQVLWTLADAGRSSVECVTSGAVFNFFAPELRGLENVDNNSVYRAVPLWGSSGAIYSATATVPSSKQAVSITLIIPVYIIIFNRKILASLKTIEKGKKITEWIKEGTRSNYVVELWGSESHLFVLVSLQG